MTQLQLTALNSALLEVSRKYLERAQPLGDSDNFICNMTTSMVIAALADALIEFQAKEVEDI